MFSNLIIPSSLARATDRANKICISAQSGCRNFHIARAWADRMYGEAGGVEGAWLSVLIDCGSNSSWNSVPMYPVS